MTRVIPTRAHRPGLPTTMPAVVQRAYGTAEQWQVEHVALPSIGDHEVLVEVTAAGLDRGVEHLMTGTPYMMRLLGLGGFGLRGPKRQVPGLDVAGRVVAVGAGVTRFAPGDDVAGIARGSFAGYAAALERKLVPLPAGLTPAAAAAVPISGLTALQAVCDVGRVQTGQHVAVLGASGGVGSFAVQIAKAAGAEVTAVCSGTKADLVRSLGADHVLDYRTGALDDATERFDVVIDIAGARRLSALRRLVRRDGTLVVVGGDTGRWTGVRRMVAALALSPFVRQRVTAFVSTEGLEDLRRLFALVEAGDVTPAVGATYPLRDAPQAMRDLTAGRVRGKAVIDVRPA